MKQASDIAWSGFVTGNRATEALTGVKEIIV